MDYAEFLRGKSQLTGNFGFDPVFIPERLFDFQKHITEWGMKKGRAAIFADTGLGKTLMQLVIAENIDSKEIEECFKCKSIDPERKIKHEDGIMINTCSKCGCEEFFVYKKVAE